MQQLKELIAAHGVPNPGIVIADFGVDTRFILKSAAITPRHNILQLIVTHNWATRISLKMERGGEGRVGKEWRID